MLNQRDYSIDIVLHSKERSDGGEVLRRKMNVTIVPGDCYYLSEMTFTLSRAAFPGEELAKAWIILVWDHSSFWPFHTPEEPLSCEQAVTCI